MNSENPLSREVELLDEEFDFEAAALVSATPTEKVAVVSKDVSGQQVDFTDTCTPKQARALLEKGRLKKATIPYVRRRGTLKATHAECAGAPGQFSSYLEALWNTEGSIPQFDAPLKTQEVQIWDGDNRVLLRFHGDLAVDRLLALAPGICSSRDHNQIAAYEAEKNFVVRISLKSWCRSAAGRSKCKSIALWEKIARDPNARGAPLYEDDTRVARFWRGVGDVHLFMTILCRSIDDFKSLRRNAMEWIMETGIFENAFLNEVKDGINQLMNVDSDHEVTKLLRTKGLELQAQYYKLRKVLPKDDSYPLTNCQRAQERFCSTEPHVKTEIGRTGIRLFQEEFTRFLNEQEPETLRRWARPAIMHQGGAGLWFTRGNGGRPEELQMIVGLHRLHLGKSSPMCENFGTLTTSDELDDLLDLWSNLDALYDEIVDACSWFLEEFVYARNIPRLFFCIFPEREVKSRTFMLYDYASQLGGNMAKCALVAFLKQTKFCEEAYKGIRALSNAHDLIDRGVREKLCVLSADASTSTDNLDFQECRQVYEPALKLMHPFAARTVEKVFSPTATANTVARPKVSPVFLFPRTNGLFRETGLTLSQSECERANWRPRGESSDYDVASVPGVRLKPHAERIVEALRVHRRVLLKSPTGSGKTVFAASVTRSIIQFTSILNLEAFSETLKHYNIDHVKHYSTSKVEKLDDTKTILTTGFYVVQLARRFPRMLVVLDEAETLRQEFLLNIIDSKSLRNDVLLMSATPDQINCHEATLVEIEATSPWTTECLEMEESVMLDEVSQSERKTLICVHSEPFARKMAIRFPESYVLDSNSRHEGYMDDVRKARVIISTNVVRSSLTIPDLDDVVDYGIQYEELDFPAQGISNLVITDVDEFQRTQLRGRVGRMRDGRYISVKHSITSVGRINLPSLRMPTVANRIESLDWSTFPRQVSLAPLVLESFTQKFLERTFEIKFTNHTPHSLQLVRTQLRKGGFFVTQLMLFEESGIPTRLSSLRLSDDPLDKELAKNFKEVTKGDYVREIVEIIAEARTKPMFRQQLALLDKWTAEQTKESVREHGLGTESAEVLLAFRYWRNVVETHGAIYRSMFRNFQATKKEGDPEYAVLIGATKFGGASKYLVAVPISKKIVDLLREQISKEIGVCLSSSEPVELDAIESLTISRESADQVGRQRKVAAVSYEQYDFHRSFEPSQLGRCLDALEGLARASTGLRVTNRGCPQSHVLSFPTLNALNYCAYLGVRNEFPDFEALGYGDDGLAVGSREACEAFLRARESYGLLTNKGSTGLSRGGEPGMAVFCEMIFDLSTGKEIISAKPKSTNYAYRAYHKLDAFSSTPSFQNDIHAIVNGLRLKLPHVHDVVMELADPKENLLPYRSTIPRQIIARMSLRRSQLTSTMTTRRAKEIVEFLEPLVLLVTPSSKGAPVRESPRDSFPTMISLDFYKEVERFLASYENYGESEFRTLPPFSQDGTLIGILGDHVGRVLNVEDAGRLMGDLQQ